LYRRHTFKCHRHLTRMCDWLPLRHSLRARRQLFLYHPLRHDSFSSSRSAAIVLRNSSISHLCAFASDSATLFTKSASDMCGLWSEPDRGSSSNVRSSPERRERIAKRSKQHAESFKSCVGRAERGQIDRGQRSRLSLFQRPDLSRQKKVRQHVQLPDRPGLH
jgi:hypothetical protein